MLGYAESRTSETAEGGNNDRSKHKRSTRSNRIENIIIITLYYIVLNNVHVLEHFRIHNERTKRSCFFITESPIITVVMSARCTRLIITFENKMNHFYLFIIKSIIITFRSYCTISIYKTRHHENLYYYC